ncbi:type 1 glutamine amidotransferase [Vibrio ulleungensis]|uniref:Type 1 glutamine amidotransferase n=1 Tax=Vibrio ulleungensis TaxID=2807619 RepID=A0ABS2HMR0_9VIBR|nr:type 1 glutamine amidotransferase [Vibrio ulleungensis]MBM7037508.1 type 1 glutamine amidotransferase [Vibrio ulleungensis]
MSTLYIIQHNVDEDPGRITQWASSHNIAVKILSAQGHEALPSLNKTDKLIVLGGEQNVGDSELLAEQTFLKTCIEKDIAVLGICLGAQLLADALGAKVTRMPRQELGWKTLHHHPVPPDSKLSALSCVDSIFLWHSYQFDIPPQAISLGKTAQCGQQGFEFGKHVGLQFHPEWQQDLLKRFAERNLWPEQSISCSEDSLKRLETGLIALLDLWWQQA